MPTSPTPDDLLALARFCWPQYTWRPFFPGSVYTEEYGTDAECWSFRADTYDGRPQDCGQRGVKGVAAAEAVLIERGLGEGYAKRVALALRREDMERPRGERHDFSDVLLGLVAPLDARVRAMVQVVKQRQKETP